MPRMKARPARSVPPQPPSKALRLARRAWRLQYPDSSRSLTLAEQAIALAAIDSDGRAEGWARLARGFHRMRYTLPAEAEQEFAAARRCLETAQDRAGQILAAVGTARCWWMQGRYRASLELLQPLRDEGLRVLKQEERGMLLNGIAGCYSALGHSPEAFAYMYQALRESSPTRNHGFDVVLYCNIAHELFQLGDYDTALTYVEEGIARCRSLANPRLLSVLLANRIVCLTDLDRARHAMPDVRSLLAMPADPSGRGARGGAFETMAIAALRAGEFELGCRLVERAHAALAEQAVADERIELVVAEAEQRCARDRWSEAAAHLERSVPQLRQSANEGLSLRVQCLFFQALADAYERSGNPAQALRHLRTWQQLHVERARRAAQARYQAASLQTELLRLQRERDEIDARRRSSERAKAELEAINRQLSQKMDEVQALQAALKQQAVRDFLTGLFNRRHLNDVLPSMLALAQRDRAPLAVAIIDLDHFKAVNDVYGHTAGDALLAAFGALLAKRLRKSDVACRYGGEEFCLLLPHTDAHAARRKIEALLRLWRGEAFTFDSGTSSGNTFSAGVADSQQVPGSFERLLKAADECVLEAKRLGRDRVVALAAAARLRTATD
jgi:diguanylate cyclase (GGDEF)-like protein